MRKRIFAALLLLALLVPFACAAVPVDTQMRGVWVSSVYNLDYPSAGTPSSDTLRAEADAILNKCAELGFNAIFLQVRPTADALYRSEIFPWSRYLTGTQGTAPDNGFDPLAYWVEGAHARGMELHAWINPYRITRGGQSDYETLSPDNPASKHPEWVIKHGDNYYFDPALQEVRDLVIDGAVEIVKNYDVDGIHLDDYFYPGTDFDDSASFARYGTGYADIADWRRNNVNLLVAELDEKLHAADPDIAFGISPSGIWENKNANPRGSDTHGYSAYSQAYADGLFWIQNGIVDYICPQIYWEIGFDAADFSTLLDWWESMTRGTDVKLYIGMAAYRSAETEKQDSVWYGADELKRQLALIDSTGKSDGSVQFRYGSVAGSPALSAAIRQHFASAPSTPSAPSYTEPTVNTPELPADAGSLFDLFSLFLYSITHA